jgi:hypothetical protein
MPEGPKAPNWWQTLPGLVTAAAALITAVAGAIVGLYQAGIFRRGVCQPHADSRAPRRTVPSDGLFGNNHGKSGPLNLFGALRIDGTLL